MLASAIVLTLLLATPEDGIGIDPNGGRRPAVTAAAGDHRCTIDPNGGPCTASATAGDRGAGLDPDGRG